MTDQPELNLLPAATLTDAADCLKVLAHPLRLRMVEILMQGDFPVHELARLCHLQPHQACEHLRLMWAQKLLSSNRQGRSVYYRIRSPRLPALIRCLRQTCPAPSDEPKDTPPFPKDCPAAAGRRRHQ